MVKHRLATTSFSLFAVTISSDIQKGIVVEQSSMKVRNYTNPFRQNRRKSIKSKLFCKRTTIFVFSTLKNPSMQCFSEIVRDESSSVKIDKIDIIIRNYLHIRDQHLQLPLYTSFQRSP
ncbi:hypothetical protein Y032_0152g2902 [Ancylostoma ceylanicum]|uniref:Uncharacterized protein n=1 Tax=Ancylostoma ceylanicum TaxID=53326 RepID=A0A016T0V7_9BILA|nr:hypothetical protein Y032_0152g2902 [Ancylostoma ceylanicum]